jgi:hypothetical protein
MNIRTQVMGSSKLDPLDGFVDAAGDDDQFIGRGALRHGDTEFRLPCGFRRFRCRLYVFPASEKSASRHC